MKRRLICLALALITTACANIPPSYKFDPSASEGLIIGSITYDSTFGLYALKLTPPPSVTEPKVDVGYSMWPPLSPMYDDQLKAKGGTFAVSVPAGVYRIRGWKIEQGYRVRESSAPIDLEFTVEAGKAIYLGNLHFSRKQEASLRDRSERDLPVLQAKYAVLKTAPLTSSIEAGVDLQDVGGRFRQHWDPVYIRIPTTR
ncbi:MAG: hypothetical protein EOP37_23765 [Rubrivivax sp.]|nr:MAG: hypothetical protein EOP37_23765 [Rubrivivax sp.]